MSAVIFRRSGILTNQLLFHFRAQLGIGPQKIVVKRNAAFLETRVYFALRNDSLQFNTNYCYATELFFVAHSSCLVSYSGFKFRLRPGSDAETLCVTCFQLPQWNEEQIQNNNFLYWPLPDVKPKFLCFPYLSNFVGQGECGSTAADNWGLGLMLCTRGCEDWSSLYWRHRCLTSRFSTILLVCAEMPM